MKQKSLFVMVVMLCCASLVLGAATIGGRVSDNNGQGLANVKIFIQGIERQAWYTNATGDFSIPAPTNPTKVTLVFEKTGFHPEKKEVELQEPIAPVQIYLSPLQMPRENVTVSVSRMNTQLIETPAATTVIGTESLKAVSRSIGAEEVLRGVPGVKVDNQANGERVHLSIRGQGILTERGIRGIQVLLDGIPLNDPTGFAPDLFDVDWSAVKSIEVLRGPAASLYGGGSAGGIINIETGDGSYAPLAANVQAFAGANGFWKTMAEASGNGNQYDFRISAARTMGDGYRDHTKFWANNLMGKFNWHPSTRFQLTAILLGTGFFNENAEGLNLTWLAQDRRMANPDANTFNEYQKTRRITGGLHAKMQLTDKQDLLFTFYARGSRWDESVPSSVQHRTFTTPGGSLQYRLFSGNDKVKNMLSAGVDMDWQKIDDHRHPNLGLAVEGTEIVANQSINQRRLGFYLIDRVQLGTQWSILFSLRHDRINNKLEDYLHANGLDLSGEVDFNKTTGKIGITWNPKAELSFYANWGQGFLPPATEELYANPNALGGFNTSLKPARSNGFEAGVRGIVAKRFTYDVAVFYLKTRDDFERYRISSRPLETFYGNAGNSRRWGSEIALYWLPIDPISISASYTYSDFKYTDYTSKTFSGDLEGNRLPNSPVHMASFEIKYRSPKGFFASIAEDLQSRAYVDPTNVPYIKGYGLLSCRLGYLFQAKSFQAELFVAGRNLTNVEYIAFTEPDPDGNSYQPGPEREIFAGIRLELK